MTKFRDITGQTFGNLTAVKRVENNNHGKTQWLFNCLCGNEHVAVSSNVINGNTSSCGCYSSRLDSKHGMWGTRLYNIYNHMVDRCCRIGSNSYENYGGRGIKICNEWLNDRSLFFDWALANGYTEELSIDRIDNNKGYSPENCQWVTTAIQAQNTRKNTFITIKGETKVLSEWAKQFNIGPSTIWHRIKSGWNHVDAVIKPVDKGGFINA